MHLSTTFATTVQRSEAGVPAGRSLGVGAVEGAAHHGDE
jgi:hypothetical protein